MAVTINQVCRQYGEVLNDNASPTLIELPFLPEQTIRTMRVELSGVRVNKTAVPVIVPADVFRGARTASVARTTGNTPAPTLLIVPTATLTTGAANISKLPEDIANANPAFAIDYWDAGLAPAFDPTAPAAGPLTINYVVGSNGRDSLSLEWNGSANQSLFLTILVSWVDQSVAQI